MTDSTDISRDARRTADEQAALLRVATMVARGIAPTELFEAVAAETGELLGAETTAVVRFEEDLSAIVAASWEKPSAEGLALALGSQWPVEEDLLAGRVERNGAPSRVISYERSVGPLSEWAREHGIRSSAGSPILVDGRLWGAIIAFSGTSAAFPDNIDEGLLAFSDLVAMAVASAERRAELVASRARVVAAADEGRRRTERDLHGTQQRLISLALELRAAEARVPQEHRSQAEQWSRTAEGLTDVVQELREICRSLHPAILETGGLSPAVRALARRAGIPVELTMNVTGRLPRDVEATAYYVVSEALANAAQHARASAVEIDIGVAGDDFRLQVRDDGAGAADVARGSGLIGLTDRVEAIGGQMKISSPAGNGTTLLVTVPLRSS